MAYDPLLFAWHCCAIRIVQWQIFELLRSKTRQSKRLVLVFRPNRATGQPIRTTKASHMPLLRSPTSLSHKLVRRILSLVKHKALKSDPNPSSGIARTLRLGLVTSRLVQQKQTRLARSHQISKALSSIVAIVVKPAMILTAAGRRTRIFGRPSLQTHDVWT